MKRKSRATLIKGYLPVRLKLPPAPYECKRPDETFFYVKEHTGSTALSSPNEEGTDGGSSKDKSDENSKGNKNNNRNKKSETNKKNSNKDVSNERQPTKSSEGCVLFVANVPVIPGVSTKLLLKSLFERFGNVQRVTVVENPRQTSATINASTTPILESTTTSPIAANFGEPSFLPPIHAVGKFAHVVFESRQALQRTMTQLEKVMSQSVVKHNNAKDDDNNKDYEEENDVYKHLPGLTLDRVEIQTLADTTDRIYREEHGLEDDIVDNAKLNDADSRKKSAVLVVAERYRQSLARLSRKDLLEECNAVMSQFETAEEADQRARENAANQPDSEGFVTVRKTANIGSRHQLEDASNGRRRVKRSRTQKQSLGASELPDFYRFQTKETRKRNLQELRERFEEDLAKVKKMKEESRNLPFQS